MHSLAVCNNLKENGFSIEYRIVALFHNLLEDTDTTYEELVEISNEEIAEAVRLVTKEKGYNMQDYINRIQNNVIAKIVFLLNNI